jgi:uncharacterized protein (UPF0261 family)
VATIAVVGALEEHGLHHQFLADCIRQRGHMAIFVDIGFSGVPQLAPHISRESVSGVPDLDWRVFRKNLGSARKMMTEAAPRKVRQLCDQQKIHGVICLGFGTDDDMGSTTLEALPFGFPKVLVSSDPAANRPGKKPLDDTLHFICAFEMKTLNRLSRTLLARAAGCVCGMVEQTKVEKRQDPPLIFASVFGNTATGVHLASELLGKEGYQVLPFHATGRGGRLMEALIAEGFATGVLDFTIKEWADEVVGGVLGAGPSRLESAARHGVPSVVVPGCLDIVNFYGVDTIPERFSGRQIHRHSPKITLLRTSPEEASSIGRRVAQKLNLSSGPTTLVLPLRGVSSLGSPGFAFHYPKADDALFESLRTNLRKDIPVIEVDATVSDPIFARTVAEALISNIDQKPKSVSDQVTQN